MPLTKKLMRPIEGYQDTGHLGKTLMGFRIFKKEIWAY